MWFSIVCEDGDNSLPLRKQNRAAHLARLESLKQSGRLLVAGPNPAIAATDPGDSGFTGSIIIAQFLSQQDAQAWADDDPYLAAGVYTSVAVKPFKKVLP